MWIWGKVEVNLVDVHEDYGKCDGRVVSGIFYNVLIF